MKENFSTSYTLSEVVLDNFIISIYKVFIKNNWKLEKYYDLNFVFLKISGEITFKYEVDIVNSDLNITCLSCNKEYTFEEFQDETDSIVDQIINYYHSNNDFEKIALVNEFNNKFNLKLQLTSEENIIQNKNFVQELKLYFIPKEGYFYTPILINLILCAFIFECLSGVNVFEPNSIDLLKIGALFKINIALGEYWRLLTAIFLHSGIIHLISNLYALFIIGTLLEQHLERNIYLSVFLITGIFSSLSSLFFNDLVVSVGSSGAVFGLFGFFATFFSTDIFSPKTRKSLLSSIGILIVLNIFYSFKEGIDTYGHFGGFISGLVLGLIYLFVSKKLTNSKNNKLFIYYSSIITILIIIIVLKSIPKDLTIWSKKMEIIELNEAKIIDNSNKFNNYLSNKIDTNIVKSDFKFLFYAKKYMDENKEIFNEIQKLNIPKKLIIQAENYEKITTCRLKLVHFTYYSLITKDTIYQDSINEYNNIINFLINQNQPN